MDFWMIWDSAKTKAKDIIKFIHVSFLARIYYNFLKNLYVTLCLLIVGSISYYYISNKFEKLSQEKAQREEIQLNLKNDFLNKKLETFSKLKEEAINFGITNDELLISLGIMANLINDKNEFRVEDYDIEMELINREKMKLGVQSTNFLTSFKSLIQLSLNGDDLYRYVAFLNKKEIKDDLGLIKDMTNYLLKERSIQYKSFLKENNL